MQGLLIVSIGRITLTSSVPGTIHASWEEPSEDPANYRISWAKVGDDFLAWIDQTGNAFPTEPRHTITGLEGGEEYKVMVRASYDGTAGDWSGEVTITVAEPPGNSQSVEDPPPPPPSNTVVLEPTGPLGPRDIGRITLTSSVPGTIHASWEEPSEDPANYRISWAKVGDDFLAWIDQTGNAFPTEPRHTITGLEGGEMLSDAGRSGWKAGMRDFSGLGAVNLGFCMTNLESCPPASRS